jgi:hypothetical protein
MVVIRRNAVNNKLGGNMPAKFFICPDQEQIEISKCLEPGGCRMISRCSTVPYLRLVSYDRKFKGISPSNAGTGPREIYLKATTDYAISPNDRAFASHGTATHEKLSIHKYTSNVLSEEKISDEDMAGIADCLEVDENYNDSYILSDFKTWGSFKVAKSLGYRMDKKDVPIMEDGKPVLLKSGKNKGQPKTKSVSKIIIDPNSIDMRSEELQLNRYRMFFEKYGFPISKIQIQAIVRDGGTYIAKNRGIEKNIYMIPVAKMDDRDVLDYYNMLGYEVELAFNTQCVRKCDAWESWDSRKCDGYCDVKKECDEYND